MCTDARVAEYVTKWLKGLWLGSGILWYLVLRVVALAYLVWPG